MIKAFIEKELMSGIVATENGSFRKVAEKGAYEK